MKQSELYFSFFLVPLDFFMIVLAAISAYSFRFTQLAAGIRPIIFNLPFGQYLQIVLLISASWIVIFALAGLYSIKSSRHLIKEIYRIILSCSTGLVLIVILIFFFRELFSSRFIVLAGWLLAIIYISLARAIVRFIQRKLFKFGIGARKVIMVGDSKTADILTREFASQSNLGYEVVKRFRDFSLESARELEEFLKIKEVDEILQSDPNLSKAEMLRLYDFADEHHLTFKYAADLLGTRVLKTEVEEIAGIPVVEVKETPLEGWGKIYKRIFDIVFSLFFIILFSPILVVVALLIKLDSAGPIIYKNERVSRKGCFKLFKFRSMLVHYCVGDEYGDEKEALEYEKQLIIEKNIKDGPVYKIADDPRLTGLGKFIRRWSIDELPQFFNVLIGDMSLVGPRPHQYREVAKYERHHKKVLSVKPGVTGLSQISGRSDLSFEDEVKLDSYYIENWSLLFDITILIRTPLAILKKRKVE
ncbi:MAG: sugar transferase [Patescibacteria group bacterium]